MQISAAQVKELRERSGAGMMECKKALQEANGNIDVAFDQLRKSGTATAAKKAGRIAAEGAIIIKRSPDRRRAVILEVNSETDFVARDGNFLRFADAVAEVILADSPADVDVLANSKLIGAGAETVESARIQLIAAVGENVNIRRFETITAGSRVIGEYLHARRIGVLVELEGGDADFAKDIAMHIAASRPLCISEAEIAPDVLAKEREILMAQAADSGKPAAIVEKMVAGRLKKFISEVTLHGQPFVKDSEQTVGDLLKQKCMGVRSFYRFEVGEGIAKKAGNFADEVRSQAAAVNPGATRRA